MGAYGTGPRYLHSVISISSILMDLVVAGPSYVDDLHLALAVGPKRPCKSKRFLIIVG